ncbi:MAG: serine/threonine protein kinase [Labilithrix sp.]|nr:serine/threonine protein kinase [Labilithrix sp.]MCW5810275.1 serine/threonine protein kinase [Labilithrix sp.]
MALEPAKLSDFKLAGSLGAGATARVWEATHLTSGRPVAIKMMDDSGSSAEMRERFAREAILLSGVESRHVSKILGFGFEKGQPFLVLERLAGETLDAKLRRDGPVQPHVAVRWIEQLIVGIRDCHDAKVIHRDIKPSNIFLHHDGFDEVVKVIDFGVARLREITDEGSGGLTSANHLIGSMGYMAPEQFTNAKGVHFTADLYAIGIVVYRTLTGRLPFVSRSLQAVIKMKVEQSVPKISAMPGMPQNPLLDWFVQKAAAKDPGVRFQSAREMLDHWWNVMASFDDSGVTDIMRGIGRVDESYAGVLHRPAQRHRTAPPSVSPPTPPTPKMPQAFAPPSFAPVSSTNEHTIHARPAFLTQDPDEAPHTERTMEETAAYVEGADPFDLPTKSDPNLRKLVERELALQRARKEGKG